MKKTLAILLLPFLLTAADNVKFTEGIAGQALDSRFKFPIPETLNTASGALEFYFKLDADMAEIKPNAIVSSGAYETGWWYIRFKEGKITFSISMGKYTNNLTVDFPELKGKVWHHFALSWGTYKEKSFARMYMDGHLAGMAELQVPESFAQGGVCLLYNNVNYASGKFPAAMDSFAFYDSPLDDAYIAQRAENPQTPPREQGLITRYDFDGNAEAQPAGTPSTERDILMALKKASRRSPIKKYSDELDFQYRYEKPMPEEKTPGTLNDGNDNTCVNWKDRKISIICELDQAYDISQVEIYCKKHTKWYILKELHVSFDDGSGDFGSPEIIKCYGTKPGDGPVVDETCKGYTYTVPHNGKACRVKISTVGDAHNSIGEIRIRGTK